MNLEKNFNFLMKISIFILFSCILTIVISVIIFMNMKKHSLYKTSEYIVLANDLNSYYTLPHQGALRIFPSFLVSV